MVGLSFATLFEVSALWAVLGIALLGLAYAWVLRSQMIKKDKGDAKMLEVWNAIRVGANAYLNRQRRTIFPFIILLTAVLFLSVYVVPQSPEALVRFSGVDPARVRLYVGIGRAAAFVMGAVFSLLVGQLG